MYESTFLRRLQRKLGFLAIPNLMMILTGAMVIVYLMNAVVLSQRGVYLYGILQFDRAAVLAGQLWRIVTFLFVPPDSGLLWTVIALFFYLFLGRSLESAWGSFGFTMYYFLGALGAIFSGLITGSATNYYLNMSLFFAFAMLAPNYEIMLFFFIPVKMKWLAWIDAALFLWSFLVSDWGGRLALLMAILNVLLFFWRVPVEWAKNKWRWIQWKRKWKK